MSSASPLLAQLFEVQQEHVYPMFVKCDFWTNLLTKANHPDYSWYNTVYDLHTSRTLALSDLLKPQTDSLLLRLITPCLERYLADFYGQQIRKLEGEPRLPESGFSLTSEGLSFSYGEGDGVASWPCVEQEALLPYAALLPLLRARSPLTALLPSRGLRAAPKGGIPAAFTASPPPRARPPAATP